VGDIGNVYTYFVISIGQQLQRKGIIKIFGIFRIDSKCGDTAEILAFFYFCCGNPFFRAGRLPNHPVAAGQPESG